MEKLLRGIVDFKQNLRPGYVETFRELALGQKPDTLMIACSDSRVVPNLFASSNPGDLFVVRNVGNLIPPCTSNPNDKDDHAERAALEFCLETLPIKDIIICGHSECGAMIGTLNGTAGSDTYLGRWLNHAVDSLKAFEQKEKFLDTCAAEPHNCLSQINVIQQLEHLRTYAFIRERELSGKLNLHGWWFDIAHANVYNYHVPERTFVLLDAAECEKILAQLSHQRNS